MTLCTQCNGKKATQGGQEMINPVTGTATNFFSPLGSAPPAQTCTQCGGNGYY